MPPADNGLWRIFYRHDEVQRDCLQIHPLSDGKRKVSDTRRIRLRPGEAQNVGGCVKVFGPRHLIWRRRDHLHGHRHSILAVRCTPFSVPEAK
jgi:hypothetical protein